MVDVISAWADYDLDGDLDLYVANYLIFNKEMKPGEPNSAFKSVKPLLMNSGLFNGEKNALYRNNSDGTFTDVTDQAGVANGPGKSMSVVFFDYDNDYDSDIYIANDKSRNILYRNNNDGTFTDVGGFLGVDSPSSGMGVTVGDYDNDGDMDIFSTYPQSATNILYKNNKEEFKDVSVDAGLGEEVGVGYFGWTAEFLDMDNDGHLDLFVANGHGMKDFDNPQATIGQQNQIFKNNGDGYFFDVSDQAGEVLKSLRSSRGAAIGDYDNDGDLDFFIVNNNGKASFLKTVNKTKNHWVNITLKGTQSNRDAIGARAKLITEEFTQIREVRSGSGYLSQMDTRLHFGLGSSSEIKALEIHWPSGVLQKFKNLKVDTFMVITEGESAIEIRKPMDRSSVKKIPLQNSGKSREKEIVEPLINALTQEDVEMRREAALTLRDLLEREAVIFRSTMLKKRKAVSALIQALSDNDDLVRKYSVGALGFSESYRAISSVIELFKDENKDVRAQAVRAAGFLRNKRATEELLRILNDHKEIAAVRGEAVFALKRLGSNITTEPLLKAAVSKNVEKRQSAFKVLTYIVKHKESVLVKKNVIIQLFPEVLKEPNF